MNYMCPEAFEDTGKGEFDPATGRTKAMMKQGRPSDIWSLGCILYQMTHGAFICVIREPMAQK